MDELDLKLRGWRDATEDLAPAPLVLTAIHAAVDQAALEGVASQASTSTAPASSATATVGFSKVGWLIASIVLAVLMAGGAWWWLKLRPSIHGVEAASGGVPADVEPIKVKHTFPPVRFESVVPASVAPTPVGMGREELAPPGLKRQPAVTPKAETANEFFQKRPAPATDDAVAPAKGHVLKPAPFGAQPGRVGVP